MTSSLNAFKCSTFENTLSGTPREVFSKVEHLKALRLDVPHTTELAFELEKAGLPMKRGILTIEEFTQEML